MFNGNCQDGIIALILWQYIKMASFSESIKTVLTVNENCLQRSLELWNCKDGYYADVDGSNLELLLHLSCYISFIYWWLEYNG